ncbi:MAG TPA: hypothetical protein VGM22_10440 [Methylomirabilota bacterium]|jgi:cellobiose-specific phosphotransferase system component IIC
MVDDARVPEQEVAMINKVLFATMAVVSLVASAAVAASLTERMEMDRMTVLKVDRVHARFLCAEHRHWTWISKSDVTRLSSGDIVSLDRQQGRLPRVTVVRTAAEELGSPE